jgi:RNA polymerase sigma-70 factor (ECF subfamily)
MNPEPEGPELTLERFRAFLSLLARLQLDPRLQGKVDLSGIVQETLLEAHQHMARLQKMAPAEQEAWLRTALAHNLLDEIRNLKTQKHDIARERSLEAALEDSSARLEASLAADESSPSQRASRNEQGLLLAECLQKLPEDQRWAIELKYWHGCKLAEIAELLGRSKGAVAKLIERASKTLRAQLTSPVGE